MKRASTQALLLVVVLLGACAVPGEPIPKGMRTYLEALTAKEYRRAYDATQLFDLVENFGQGASLSFAHFEAFHKANPLKSYTVEQVTRLDARPMGGGEGSGTPFFEIDVTLRTAAEARRDTFTVLGEVLPRVQVEPDRLFLKLPAGSRSIEVDGVRTEVRAAKLFDGQTAYPVLLLRGAHEVSVGAASARISTSPPKVLSGDGELIREADQATLIRIG